MKSVYIMLLLNPEDPLRKENAFKDGKTEIVKIGNSSDVEKRKTQINVSHNNLLVEEIFEYPFYNFILIENKMHSEFEPYKDPIIDKNGASLSEYYRVDKEIYNKIRFWHVRGRSISSILIGAWRELSVISKSGVI